MSLMDLYIQMEELDAPQEKAAAQQAEQSAEAIKLAQDYDAAGRAKAHVDFNRWASEKLGAEEHEEKETPAEERKEEERKRKAKKEEKKEEGEGGEQSIAERIAEKKSSILAKMAEDPEYAKALVQHYLGQG
jgi:endogenous inhibitor of DNA gyrase (YacG/DUF329 family)